MRKSSDMTKEPMEEVEVKLGVPEEARESLEADLQRRGSRRSHLRALYFDTPDGLLAGKGLSLRVRKEEQRWVQTLKAYGDGSVHRLEHNVELAVADGAMPIVDPALHNGSSAGAVLSAVLHESGRTEALVEWHTTEVSRQALTVRAGDSEMEVALDLGTIRADSSLLPVCELEIELKSGPRTALFDMSKSLVSHGGLWLMVTSKAQRGMRLARGETVAAALHAKVPRLDKNMDGEQLLRAILRSCLEQVSGNAGEVAAGSVDEHHVHQLRVGLRRLRTALRELGVLSAQVNEGWEAPLTQTFSLLGEFRDDKTVAGAVRPLLEAAQAPLLEWREATDKVEPTVAVRDSAFQTTLLDLIAFSEAIEVPEGPTPERAREHVVARLDKLHKQVVREGQRFESLADVDQHRVRKRLKRLRYLCEFVESLYEGKRFDRYLKLLRPAQDALGEHNDMLVALDRFRRQAKDNPAALFAVGFLQSRLAITAKACCAALKNVEKARRFWRD